MDDHLKSALCTGKYGVFAVAALILVMVCPVFADDPVSTSVVLPNGRRVTPAGRILPLAPFPFAMTMSPDGRQIVAVAIGWPYSFNIVDTATSTVRRIPPGHENLANIQVHTGVAFSLDGKLLYDATGNTGAVDVMSTTSWQRVARITLDAGKYKDSFAASLALSPDGKRLYVVDQGNWRIVVIDTATQKVLTSVATGVNPLNVALSPDGQRLYVTNSGLFEYDLIEKAGPQEKKADDAEEGLKFPPAGYPSKAAREGVIVEGYKVAGLGDENDPRGSSLWTYSLESGGEPHLLAKLRLGAKITETPKGVVGGASPSGVVADDHSAYVSLTHEDSVAVVSRDGGKLEAQIELSPFTDAEHRDKQGRLLRGVGPLGMALAGNRLYVAESGINAVAVIDTHTSNSKMVGKRASRLLGLIPTGWYPAAVIAGKTQLYVLSNKGSGAGPNANAHGQRQYIGELENGSLATLPLDTLEAKLPAYTQTVLDDDLAPAAQQSVLPKTSIKHVFFIIRENRTYDEILGDLPGADGDAKLARFGMHGWVAENVSLRDLQITPNAHAIAARFATSDRYSADSEVSADGHRWAVGIAPTPWMSIAFATNYSGRRTDDPKSSAPGRRAMSGGSDGPMPEDEPEFGSMWEHVADAPLQVVNYGEGLEVEGNDERDGTAPEGQRLYENSPVPNPIFKFSDRLFPTFNLGIPDQNRFTEFSADFQKRLDAGADPALVVIRLPDDHTASPRPGDGYPYKASYVADNDLALGKIVDYISHSAIWKDSAIFVIEDDAQDGADHFDAHRSPVFVISPWVKPGYVSHTRTSMAGVLKTIYALLGVGPLNLEDGLSAGVSDMFTTSPDLTAFNFVPSDTRVFDPTRAKIARPKNAKQARELLDCDDADEIETHFHRKGGER